MSYGIVYLITNKNDGKRYVGQTTKPLQQRWWEHCHAHRYQRGRRMSYMANAVKAYGKDAFEQTILQECESAEELNAAERKWIIDLETLAPNGYNLSPGGEKEKGFKHSEESKKWMSEVHMGHPVSDETKRKLSEAAKVRVISDEGRAALSKAAMGNDNRVKRIPVDQYSIDGKFIQAFPSMIAAREAVPEAHGMYSCIKREARASGGFIWRLQGDTVTEEDLKDLAENANRLQARKAVIQLDLFGNEIARFLSAREAQRVTGISASCIVKCCHGLFKKTHGFVFKFAESVITAATFGKGVKDGDL